MEDQKFTPREEAIYNTNISNNVQAEKLLRISQENQRLLQEVLDTLNK